MTSEQLSAIAGVLLSLFFFYVPRVGPWYESQTPSDKAKIMGLFIVLTGVGAFALSCFELAEIGVSCDAYGLKQVAVNIVFALMANQGTFTLVNKLKNGHYREIPSILQ